jgi:hypothetical protein
MAIGYHLVFKVGFKVANHLFCVLLRMTFKCNKSPISTRSHNFFLIFLFFYVWHYSWCYFYSFMLMYARLIVVWLSPPLHTCACAQQGVVICFFMLTHMALVAMLFSIRFVLMHVMLVGHCVVICSSMLPINTFN